MRNKIIFFLNGEKVEVSPEDSFLMLADYVRQKRYLPGTKIVCAEGDCGACTVLIGKPQPGNPDILNYKPYNSCIIPVFNIDATHVVTVEGLKEHGELNPIQLSVANNGGSQCGYCTPGIVMAISGVFEQVQNPQEKDFRNGLTGNLCRCTGYEGILKAALNVNKSEVKSFDSIWHNTQMKEAINLLKNQSLEVSVGNNYLAMPNSLQKFITIKAMHPDAKIIAGATDLGVHINKHGVSEKKFLSLARTSLNNIEQKNTKVEIGANVSLTEFEEFCAQQIPAVAEFMQVFASPQIKNSGTLVGNIANGSPIGDTLPILCAIDAVLELTSANGNRMVNINQFYLGYKKFNLNPDEVIIKIHINIPSAAHTFKLYKVAKRKHLDISTVSAVFLAAKENNLITEFKVAMGGVAESVKRIPEVEQFLLGKEINHANMRHAMQLAVSKFSPLTDVRGSSKYRKILVQNLMEKFFIEWGVN